MSRFSYLSPDLAVAGALSPEDFAEVARIGFRAIVNNRPDNEEAGQLTALQEAELAAEAGLTYDFVPAAKYEVLDAPVLDALQATLDRTSGPVLLHCRSGLRSTIMWAALQVRRGVPAERVLATAKLAGFDLGAVREEIIELGPQRQAAADEQARAAA